MRTFSMATVVLAAALSCLLELPARGEQPAGRLVSRSFAALPSQLELAVEPDDNADTNMALAERMKRELAQLGTTHGGREAQFVLRFDSEIRSNVASGGARFGREPSGVDGADMSIGAAGPPDAKREVPNLLSSQEGRGLIGERGGGDYRRPLRYVINARIEDRNTGAIVWQGHVSYDSDRTDEDPIFQAMAPLLLHEIGRTVRERHFSLE